MADTKLTKNAPMNQPNRDVAIKQILSMEDYKLSCSRVGHPTQGQLVTTGPQMTRNLEKRLGFCVQVRKGCGQFGSDMVFLRHPDGTLTTHENQSYCGLTEEQEALARPLFVDLPEDEDYSVGYLCCNKLHEVGFIIENSASPASPNTPFMVTIQDGSTKTLIAHI